MKTILSHYNGTIAIKHDELGYSLLVDGFMQSGPNIELIWNEAFDELIPNAHIQNVLILGFGGGSIVSPLLRRWPDITITAVEIDPMMVQLAKKYFPENMKDIKIITADALGYISKVKPKKQFDLIIVDCYIGGTQPKESTIIPFFVKLKILAGTVLVNQLFLPNQKNEMKKIAFLKTLDTLYSVKALKLPFNIIIQF